MIIRPMGKAGLEDLFAWAESEGWKSEPIHIACLFSTQPDAFLGGFLDGRMIAMVIAVKQGASLGIISNFFVLGAFRDRGYGRALFEHALRRLKDREIILDSVPDKTEMYRQTGFRPLYHVSSYRFIVGSVTLPTRPMQAVSHLDMDQLIAYDTKATGYDRTSYLRCMFTDETMRYRGVEKDSILSSYGLCFAYSDGYKLLLATTNNINEALVLFFALIEEISEETPVYMDVSAPEQMILAMISVLRMRQVSQTDRMHRSLVDDKDVAS